MVLYIGDCCKKRLIYNNNGNKKEIIWRALNKILERKLSSETLSKIKHFSPTNISMSTALNKSNYNIVLPVVPDWIDADGETSQIFFKEVFRHCN